MCDQQCTQCRTSVYELLLPWHPMQSTLLNLVARILSSISLPMNHRIGAAIGWLAWTTHSKLRTITLINLSLCFPDWSEEQINRVGKDSLIETGKTLTESFWLWGRPNSDIDERLVIVEGEHLLREAQGSAQGLIVATPHMGSWESCCLPLVTDEPVTFFYKPPRMKAIEPLLIAGRENLGGDGVKLDSAGIKRVLNVLKNGKTIGILPDQEPDLESGHFALTLLAKFANKTASQVLFCYAKRLPNGAGWQIHYLPPATGVDDKDIPTATSNLP